ncbi:thioesterase family protein [Pontibacter sp. G13]|uniref:acyl-CoA thioesterase n=1 Tax=Pontibacter sp. G13 TaxID=3074898 RepID=UPI00288A8537|nr:thioesterase family protein [Pontibacter sp. G13]WNJ21362.1 thioesterase family protein [Pontibacter sp. G13]
MLTLEEFPHQIHVAVQWGDMDAARHVNNTVYALWAETARVGYLQEFDPGAMADQNRTTGPVLGSLTCKYMFPVTFPDMIWIGTRLVEIKEDRFTMECFMFSESYQRAAAFLKATCVNFDFSTNSKAPLPDDFAERVHTFEANCFKFRGQ